MTIGDSFKRFRKLRGLTQQQVADALKIQKSAYQRYEHDKVIPAATLILNLADLFNVSTDYLLGRSDEPRPPKFDEKTLNLIRAMQAFQSPPTTEAPAQ